MSSGCRVVRNEGTKKNRGTEEGLCLLEIRWECDGLNGVDAILGQSVAVILDMVSQKTLLKQGCPNQVLENLQYRLRSMAAAIQDALEFLVRQVHVVVGTNQDVVIDNNTEITHISENVSNDALKIRRSRTNSFR